MGLVMKSEEGTKLQTKIHGTESFLEVGVSPKTPKGPKTKHEAKETSP